MVNWKETNPRPQEYYFPLGWRPFPNLETILPPTPTSSDTIPLLCNRDVSAVISDIRSGPLPPGIHTRFAFLPTYAQAAWHFEAEEFTASKIFTSPPRTPSIKGAISSSGETWGYWVHNYNEDKLIFLRLVSLHSSTPEEERATSEIAAVLRAAQAEAADWSLKKAVIWNPEPRTLAACKLVLGDEKEPEVQKRTDQSIPCLRWKGGSGEGEVEKGVAWVALEKYSWC